jgi:hypothetical protein
VVGTGGANLRQFRAVESNSEVRASSSAGVLVLEPDGYGWRFAPAAGGSLTESGSGTCH